MALRGVAVSACSRPDADKANLRRRCVRQVVLFYECYMMAVQIMLLNLLIAIMSDCYSRVHHQAQLVAHLKRAEIILEQERALVRTLSLTPLKAVTAGHDSPSVRMESEWRRSVRHSWFGQRMEECWTCGWRVAARVMLAPLSKEEIVPRWLHVLLPVEHATEAKPEAAALSKIENIMVSSSEERAADQQRLAELVRLASKSSQDRDNAMPRQVARAVTAELSHGAQGPSTALPDETLRALEARMVKAVGSAVDSRMAACEACLSAAIDGRVSACGGMLEERLATLSAARGASGRPAAVGGAATPGAEDVLGAISTAAATEDAEGGEPPRAPTTCCSTSSVAPGC